MKEINYSKRYVVLRDGDVYNSFHFKWRALQVARRRQSLGICTYSVFDSKASDE